MTALRRHAPSLLAVCVVLVLALAGTTGCTRKVAESASAAPAEHAMARPERVAGIKGAGESSAVEEAAATATREPSSTPQPSATMQPTETPTPAPSATPEPTVEPSATPIPVPTDTALPPFRPPTGMLEDHAPGGYGELNIKNGTSADALVVLTTLDGQAVKSAYIWMAESFNMTGIQDGEYLLYYSKGEAFDAATHRFTQNATYQKMDTTIPFSTTETQYTVWEITLYGVAGGTVGSEPVDPDEFP
ncbi:MAG: hypothetical protein ACYC4R_02320 [Anaerolineae bacterium]